MRVLVDVPNWLYDAMQEHREPVYSQSLGDAVRDGISFPRRYGTLMILSEDKLKENQINLDSSCQKWISEVGLSNATVAIIKADRA